MACIAGQREALRLMIWVGCLSVLPHMTGRTVRKHAILPTDDGFVAPFAFDRGVRAKQRKEIAVIADLLFGSEPALHDVALGAIRAEFAQVNIGMAIVAILANIGKHRLRMTLRARKFFVPAAKREFCLIVVESGTPENRAPAGSRMAILARNRQRAMRLRSRVPLSESDRGKRPEQNCAGESSKNEKRNACQRSGRSLKIANAPEAFAGWTPKTLLEERHGINCTSTR